jgi:phosphatidylglycerophosphate synthase
MIPNLITLFRVCLSGPIIFLLSRGRPGDFPVAGVLILLATLSDGLDGLAARRLNMASLFGAMFDLTADRIIMTPSLLLLSFQGRFGSAASAMPLCPWPFTILVVIADLSVLAGIAAYLLQRRRNPDIEFPKPPFIVKITYTFQMLPVLTAAFFGRPGWLLDILMINAMLFTIISFVTYLKKGGFVFDIKSAN